MLTLSISTAQAVARLGPGKGEWGWKGWVIHCFPCSMIIIPHYREKHCLPCWSEYSACEPGPNLTFQYAATKHTVKSHIQEWELHHEVAHPTFTSLMHLWHFRHHCLHFVPFCLPWSRTHCPFQLQFELKWSIFVRVCLAETSFGYNTFRENHLYLASYQACCVISTEHHWAATISCPLISLERTRHYTVQNMADNALFVLHKRSPKLWHGVKTSAAYFVLSPMLLSRIRADLQSPPHKACIYRLKWHMQLQGHCFSPQSN